MENVQTLEQMPSIVIVKTVGKAWHVLKMSMIVLEIPVKMMENVQILVQILSIANVKMVGVAKHALFKQNLVIR